MLKPIQDKTKDKETYPFKQTETIQLIEGLEKNINKGTVLNTNSITKCEKKVLGNISNKVVHDESLNDMETVPELQETRV